MKKTYLACKMKMEKVNRINLDYKYEDELITITSKDEEDQCKCDKNNIQNRTGMDCQLLVESTISNLYERSDPVAGMIEKTIS